jgi:hypothetical protein
MEPDFNKLTTRIAALVESNLLPIFDDVPASLALLSTLTKLSQLAIFKRVRSKYYETSTFSNMYALVFYKSGGGKDKIPKFIEKKYMGSYYQQFNFFETEYKNKRFEKVMEQANQKFKASKANKEAYIERHEPRQLLTEYSNATLEGFTAQREAYADAGFGGTSLKISEFGDYITSPNQSRLEFLSALTDCYDDGDSLPKITKGERRYLPVKGVPSVVQMHTSLSGLLEGPVNLKLMTLLNRGLARRTFICYPEVPKFVEASREERFYKLEEAAKIEEEFKTLFNKYISGVRLNDEFTATKQVNDLIFDYIQLNRKQASKLDPYTQEALVAEQYNRHWKAIKLAGIIASFEHPTIKRIEINDMLSAIYIADLFAKHFIRFFSEKPRSAEETLLRYFQKDNNINRQIPTMEIRNLKLVPERNFKWWMDNSAVPYIQDMTGNALILNRGEKNSIFYTLVDKSGTPNDLLDMSDFLIQKYGKRKN